VTIDYLFYFGMIILFASTSFFTGRVVYRGLKYGQVKMRGATVYKLKSQPISFWSQMIMESLICLTVFYFLVFKFIFMFPRY